MMKHRYIGFSLSEMLIVLGILGVIAALTLPKLLNNSNVNDKERQSAGRAAMVALSSGLSRMKLNENIGTSTTATQLMNYINYVNLKTTGTIDAEYTGTTETCSGSYTCAQLPSGGFLRYKNTSAFTGTAPTNAIYFHFDPDDQVDGTPTGQGKSVMFWLYYDGAVRTSEDMKLNTVDHYGTLHATPDTGKLPPWWAL